MSKILNDPKVQAAVRLESSEDVLRAKLANLLTSNKTWETMNTNERKVYVHHLVAQAESELELSRLLNEAGCTDCTINWSSVNPQDEIALETQALVKALGGLVSKSGALVMIMTSDDDF